MSKPIEIPPHSRRVVPTRTVYQGHDYVPAASTDLRKRFAEIRASQQPAEPANVSPIQRRRNSSAKGL